MPKVKCRYCGKSIDKKEAYCVRGNTNKYYCNEEHSKLLPPRTQMFKLLQEIIGEVTSTIFYSEFDNIAKIHGYEKVIEYTNQNRDYLEKVMSRDFGKTYNKIRYFAAIYKNSLDDFEIPKKEVKKAVEIELYETKVQPKKSNRKGMDDLLEELMNE